MGISFSALELPIRAPGGEQAIKTLADIDRQAQAVAKEVDGSLRAFDRFAKQIDITDRVAVKAFRQSAAAEREWLNVSRANTDQHARLTQIVQQVDQRMQRAAPNFSRAANASVTMASGLEQLARTGNATGEGLKTVISQGSNIAFMFGTAGPIIGAIGILGVAMFNFWDRRAREVRNARIQMLTELETLARGADLVGAAEKQQRLYSGDQYAIRKPDESDAAWLARSRGLQVIRPRVAELERQLPKKTLAQLQGADGRIVATMAEHMLTSPLVKEYAELRRLLEQMEGDYTQVTEVVDRLTEAEGRRARNGQEIEARLRAQTKAEQEANAARARALQLAQDALKLGPGGGRGSGGGPQLIGTGIDAAANRMLDEYFGGAQPNNRFGGVKLPKATRAVDLIAATGLGQIVLDAIAEMDKIGQTLEGGISQTIGSAIYDGFAAGFSGDGLGGIFEAFGETVLAGIGGVMTQMGMIYLEYGALMTGLVPSLANPFTAGPTALAIGAALVAMGAALGAVAAGRGGGGGGGAARSGYGGGAAQIIDRGIINPVSSPHAASAPITARESRTTNVWVIGENDPRAQSALKRMVGAADKRGSL